MNALKTVVNQIETFGTRMEEYEFKNVYVKYYRIDTVTIAIIYYNSNGKPRRVSFIYG